MLNFLLSMNCQHTVKNVDSLYDICCFFALLDIYIARNSINNENNSKSFTLFAYALQLYLFTTTHIFICELSLVYLATSYNMLS